MSVERSWCPQCCRWVPFKEMNHYVDEAGRVIKVCNFCLEGTESDCVKEPNHEKTQCIYCDSYNTVEQAPNWRHYYCKDCGATFKIFSFNV